MRYIQPGKHPTRKVAYATAGAGGAQALIWAASLAGLDIPAGVAEWAVQIVGGMVGALIGGYFTTERMQGT